MTPADTCMTSDPINALHSGQEFFLPNLVAIRHSWAVWPLVDPGCSLCDLWPQQCTTLRSGFLSTKFGSHRAFLRQFHLRMTFDLGWVRFENMLLSLLGPSPNAKFQPYTSKHNQTHSRTDTQTDRLLYFSSIEGNNVYIFVGNEFKSNSQIVSTYPI